jgi:hypothetical protein
MTYLSARQIKQLLSDYLSRVNSGTDEVTTKIGSESRSNKNGQNKKVDSLAGSSL